MNYYNENNPKIAAWLEELIAADLISNGIVDKRSIEDVQPKDLEGYQQCHFFAGIGGWSYALRLAGWPDDEPIWTASLPCQPFSCAGKRKGKKDERNLWPIFAQLIKAQQPAMVIGEQVASKDGREWLSGIFADLEGMGYQRAGADLCAAGVGAPHIRQRLYWLAYSQRYNSKRWGGLKDLDGTCSEVKIKTQEWQWCRNAIGDSGTTGRLDDANEQGSQGRSKHAGERENKQLAWPASEFNRLENSKSKRLERPAGTYLQEDKYGLTRTTQWSDFEIIPCRDEKTRRIECGTLPLVDRPANRMVPSSDPSREETKATPEARIVRLQGYGNAIVPQLAVEFILAAQEAILEYMKISQQEKQTT